MLLLTFYFLKINREVFLTHCKALDSDTKVFVTCIENTD